MIRDCLHGPLLTDFAGWRFEIISSRQGNCFFKGKKLWTPKCLAVTLQVWTLLMQILQSFTWGRLLKGIGCYLFVPPPPLSVICPIASLGSLVLKMPALGFLKNKLSMNDDYFSYFHFKGQRVEIKKSFLPPEYCLDKIQSYPNI